jgi:hypothetical protein
VLHKKFNAVQKIKNDVARRWLENEGNTYVQETSVVIPLISTWLLGLGESQVLSYVQTHSDCVARDSFG